MRRITLLAAGSVLVAGVAATTLGLRGGTFVTPWHGAGAQPVASVRPAAARDGPSPAGSDRPLDTGAAQAALTSALDRLVDGGQATLSAQVRDDRTGATLRYRPDARYQTASVVKVDILATLLLQTRHAGRQLTGGERAEAVRMITASDNAAATTLWNDVGGGPALTAANHTFGLVATTAGPPGYWGLTETTVADQVRLLDTALDPDGPLGPSGAAYLRALMADVEPDQAWGVSAAAGDAETVAVKNGWDIRGDAWIVNSVGRISGTGGSVTVAVLSYGSPNRSDGITLVENATRLARTHLDALD